SLSPGRGTWRNSFAGYEAHLVAATRFLVSATVRRPGRRRQARASRTRMFQGAAGISFEITQWRAGPGTSPAMLSRPFFHLQPQYRKLFDLAIGRVAAADQGADLNILGALPGRPCSE